MAERKTDQSRQTVHGAQVNAGRDVNVEHWGDKITAGDVRATNVAIGRGAQVIVNKVHEALSAIDEMEKGIQAAERRLAKAISNKVARYAALDVDPDAAPTDDRRNPYKALLDYRLEDAPYFYGRAEAIAAMMERMQQERLTVLHSDSGSGKTSLLQAGLASRLLAEGHFPLYLRPYRTPPGRFIKRAFLSDYATRPELARFRDEQMSLKGFLERVTLYLGDRRLYVFLDQFEEFFTELGPEAQHTFAARLQDCVESDLPVWWVLALRKEYFSDLRVFRALRPYDNEFFLPTFSIEEAQEVVTAPAGLKGVTYEGGLVDDILADLHQEEEGISPAQVQLVCYTLFEEKAPEQPVITRRLYQQRRGRGQGRPGAEGILTSHLTRVLERELSGRERQLARGVLRTLVTSQKRRAQRSRRAIITELQSVGNEAAVDESALDHVLKTLDNSRLVRVDEDDQDKLRYELAHEYLLDEIEVDPQIQAIKVAQEILDQEVSYYRDHGVLLAKDKYDIVSSQREHLHLDQASRELLDKSEERFEAERKQELRQAQALAQANQEAADNATRAEAEAKKREQSTRRWLRVAITLVVIAITGTGIAVYQSSQASKARDEAEENAENLQAELLADWAFTELSRDEETLALLLAIESYTRAHDAEVHRLLRTVIEERQPDMFGLPGAAKWAKWNATESYLLTGSMSSDELFHGNLMVWARGKYERPLAILPDSAQLAKWNAAGDRFITWSWDGPVSVWDVAILHTGEPRLTLPETASWAIWTSDGGRILTRHSDRWRVWDGLATTPEPALYTFEPNFGAEWSQDSTHLPLFLEDGTVIKLDATSLEPIWRLPGTAEVAEWSPTGTSVWVKREEADSYELWDATSQAGEHLVTLPPSYQPVTDGWSQDGSRLLLQRWTEGVDGLFDITLLDVNSGTEIRTLDEPVRWAVWEEGDTHVITLRESGVVDLWDGQTGLITASLQFIENKVWYWNDRQRRRVDAIAPMINGLNDTELSFVSLLGLPEQILSSSRPITWMGWSDEASRSRIITWDRSRATATVWTKDGTQPLLQFEDVQGVGVNEGIPAIQAYDNTQQFLVASETSVKLYPADPAKWLELACQSAEQNLSWEAWGEAFPSESYYHRTCSHLPVHPSVVDAVLLEHFPEGIDPYLRQWERQDPVTVVSVRQAIPDRIDETIMSILRLDDLQRAIQLVSYYEQSFADGQVSPETLNVLCWSGALFGQVNEVLPFCNRAAEMEPENGLYVAGRGLARSLTGNYSGAAADFRLYQRWLYSGDMDELDQPPSFLCAVCEYPYVIEQLEANENPFNADEMAWLRSDWSNYFYWE